MKSVHVSTLEQSEQMRDMGINQNALYSWCGDINHAPKEYNPDNKPWVWVGSTHPSNGQEGDHRNLVPSAKPFAAAFTVAELNDMLPANVHSVKRGDHEFEVFVYKKDHPDFDYQGGNLFFLKSDYSIAEALSGFLIYAAQKEIIGFTVTEINNRLNEHQGSNIES